MIQDKFFPLLSIVLLIITFVLKPVYDSKNEVDVDRTNDNTFSLNQLMYQYFEVSDASDARDILKALMWLSLLLVEIHMGIVFTLLISLVAFLNWGATKYLAGSLSLSLSGASYTGHTFVGSFLAVIIDMQSALVYRQKEGGMLRRALDSQYVRKPILILLVAMCIAVMTFTDNTIYHNAFPLMIGFIVTGIVISHDAGISEILSLKNVLPVLHFLPVPLLFSSQASLCT